MASVPSGVQNGAVASSSCDVDVSAALGDVPARTNARGESPAIEWSLLGGRRTGRGSSLVDALEIELSPATLPVLERSVLRQV